MQFNVGDTVHDKRTGVVTEVTGDVVTVEWDDGHTRHHPPGPAQEVMEVLHKADAEPATQTDVHAEGTPEPEPQPATTEPPPITDPPSGEGEPSIVETQPPPV